MKRVIIIGYAQLCNSVFLTFEFKFLQFPVEVDCYSYMVKQDTTLKISIECIKGPFKAV